MTNTPNIDWIKDIEPDPKFVRRMIDQMFDAVDDDISDFVFQIITDYVPNSGDESLEYEDWVMDNVHNPLYDKILTEIIKGMTSGEG